MVPELALEDLFASFSRVVRAQVLRATADESLADDVVQEVFAAALAHRDQLDPVRVQGWLMVVARNRLIDAMRRSGRTTGLVAELPVMSGEEHIVDRVALAEAIQSLAPLQREAVIEVLVNGCSSAELASRRGVPQGTIRSRLHYGVIELRRLLDARDD